MSEIVLVSLDVQNLFKNIPVEQVLNITKVNSRDNEILNIKEFELLIELLNKMHKNIKFTFEAETYTKYLI